MPKNAGSSISSALWLGLDRENAFRFSFLLSIPLILGAGVKKALEFDAAELERIGGPGPLLLGMTIAFLVGLASVHSLLRIVRGNKLHLFGWYNLCAAIIFAIYLLQR